MNPGIALMNKEWVLLNLYFLIRMPCICFASVCAKYNHKLNTYRITIFVYRVSYAGDNFVRYTGATISMAQTQCKY